MTTFTITCPPTVAGTTSVLQNSGTTSQIGLSDVDDSFASASQNEGGGNTIQINESSDRFSSFSNSQSVDRFYPEDYGGGNDYFWLVSTSETVIAKTTQLWNGDRTRIFNSTYQFSGQPAEDWNNTTVINDTTIVWTSFVGTSSQTTTTQEATVYETTSSDTINVITLSGTTVQTGTMTAAVPSTITTQTQGFTTATANLSTTYIATTTQEDTFAKWRTSEGGETHRGTYQEATVVCLENSENAWVVTERPIFTATSTAVVEQQTATQFTVFPSFIPTAGHVEEAVYETDTDAEELFTFSTSSEVIETPATYETTAQAANTITAALQFTSLPSPLSQQVGTTMITQNWFSTIIESRFTGGDTSTTTIFSTTTHQGRIGEVTWNASHRASTTAITTFEHGSRYISSTSETFVDEEYGNSGEYGNSQTLGSTFSRAVSMLASRHAPLATQNQCGSSLSWAVAAASNLTSAAQEIGAVGISITMPQSVTLAVAQTARTPLGTWGYVTGGSTGTTISASAGPASLSVTSAFGPASAITTESTEGAWTLAGAAVSRANLPLGQRINLGGVAPIGTATAFYDAGIYSTSDASTSGTLQVSQARTESINPSADRTAYLPASGVFISGGQRYNIAARNIPHVIAESAIITAHGQLIL
jgi:hypothetical protein